MDSMQQINTLVKSNNIVLFLKGSTEQPTCEFSDLAVRILDACRCEYLAVNIQNDPVIRANLPKYKGCATFPQLFVQGQLIGGADVIEELFESGELGPMLQAVSQPLRMTG